MSDAGDELEFGDCGVGGKNRLQLSRSRVNGGNAVIAAVVAAFIWNAGEAGIEDSNRVCE